MNAQVVRGLIVALVLVLAVPAAAEPPACEDQLAALVKLTAWFDKAVEQNRLAAAQREVMAKEIQRLKDELAQVKKPEPPR